MLRFCGILTLALNTAGALGHRQFGTALVDAVGPALLIGWSEVGPWLLRQVYAVCPPVARNSRKPRPRSRGSPVLPGALLARARELDAGHRAATGSPSPATPSARQLRIGRDRASALVAAIRAEAAASAQANPGPLRAA